MPKGNQRMPPLDVRQLSLAHKSHLLLSDIEKQWNFEAMPMDVKLASGTTLLIVGIIGISGNSLVLITILRILQYRRTLPNILIRNLAVVDLCAIPFSYTQTLIYYFSDGYKGGRTACQMHSFSILFLHYISIILITAMCVDRYLALSQPFCYEKHLSPNGIWLKCFTLLVFIISFVISILPAFGIGRNVLHYPGSYCLFDMSPKHAKTVMYTTLSILFLGLTISIVIYCNLGVTFHAYKLYHGTKQMSYHPDSKIRPVTRNSSGQEELLLIRLSLAMCFLFLFCWMPSLVRMVYALTGGTFSAPLDFTSARMASMHAVLNAWMYPLLRRQYREAFAFMIQHAISFLSCRFVKAPQTTLDDIIGAHSKGNRGTSIDTGRRKSYEQRQKLVVKDNAKVELDDGKEIFDVLMYDKNTEKSGVTVTHDG